MLARDGRDVHLGVAGIGLVELRHGPDLLPDDPASAGLFHTAFLLPSRRDLGRWLVHARDLGQPLDGAADHLVSEAVHLHDPEGNGVEVYADRPRQRWLWRAGPDGRPAERWVEMANHRLDGEGLVRLARPSWTGAPGGTRVGHVHLRVGDVAEASRFYAGALSMDVTAAWTGAVFHSTGGYHHHLAANTWQSAGAGRRDTRRAGLAAITFDAADEAVLADIGRRAGAAVFHDHGASDPWGTTLRVRPTAAAAAGCPNWGVG